MPHDASSAARLLHPGVASDEGADRLAQRLNGIKLDARSAIAAGDFDRAERILAQATRSFPNAASIMALQGVLAMRRGRMREAGDAFLRAHRIDPDDRDLLVYAGRCLAHASDPKAVADLIALALRDDPFHPAALGLLSGETPATVAERCIGCVWWQAHGLAGWACDPQAPDRPQRVALRLADGRGETVLADRFDPRLRTLFRGTGRHAFFWPVAGPRAGIEAQVEGVGLILSRAPHRPPQGGAAWVEGDALCGWAADPLRPTATVRVDARAGTRWSRSATADGQIPPHDPSYGDGRHGFRIPLDDLPADTALVQVDGDGLGPLEGSPVLVSSDLTRARLLSALAGWLRDAAEAPPDRPPPLPPALSEGAALAVCRAELAGLGLSALPSPSRPAAQRLLPPSPDAVPDGGDPIVSVIVPVHSGLKETAACLDALAATRSRNATPFRTIVVDDATPDPDIRTLVEDRAARGDIVLLRHDLGAGFAATVNTGIANAAAGDVVLLNSDTLMQGDWLDRLRRSALSAPDIGTVTPLSNSGSICSYPDAAAVNGMPAADQLADLDGLCARLHAGITVDIPTGVGFCLYIRRRCLDEVGAFDAKAFPRGYGEENDFCMRAFALGWRHVAAADVFIGHWGGTSFGPERAALLAQGERTLAARHPLYPRRVAAFLRADPLLPVRRRLDAVRLAAALRQPPNQVPDQVPDQAPVVLVTTDMAGGVRRHVEDRLNALRAQGLPAIVVEPGPRGAAAERPLRVRMPGGPDLPNLLFRLPEQQGELRDLLAGLQPRAVEIHNTLHLPGATLDVVRGLGAPYRVVVHDYAWICPRVTLIDGSDRYCGEPDDAACDVCVTLNGSFTGDTGPVAAMRRRARDLLEGASHVTAPSRDAARRMARYAPDARIQVEPHADRPLPDAVAIPAWDGRRTLRVVCIGAIGDHKGFRTLLGCAVDAARRALPLEFAVVGYSHDDDALAATGRVHVSGPFDEAEAVDLTRAQGGDLALFLSPWPETWCYALSVGWAAGLYALAPPIGALEERIGDTGLGECLAAPGDPRAVNDQLLAAARRLAGHRVPRRPAAATESTRDLREV